MTIRSINENYDYIGRCVLWSDDEDDVVSHRLCAWSSVSGARTSALTSTRSLKNTQEPWTPSASVTTLTGYTSCSSTSRCRWIPVSRSTSMYLRERERHQRHTERDFYAIKRQCPIEIPIRIWLKIVESVIEPIALWQWGVGSTDKPKSRSHQMGKTPDWDPAWRTL